MKTKEQINKEISKLQQKLKTVQGRETEVYTRIVGYYRPLRNWNKGKSEEYGDRKLFIIQKNDI